MALAKGDGFDLRGLLCVHIQFRKNLILHGKAFTGAAVSTGFHSSERTISEENQRGPNIDRSVVQQETCAACKQSGFIKKVKALWRGQAHEQSAKQKNATKGNAFPLFLRAFTPHTTSHAKNVGNQSEPKPRDAYGSGLMQKQIHTQNFLRTTHFVICAHTPTANDASQRER